MAQGAANFTIQLNMQEVSIVVVKILAVDVAPTADNVKDVVGDRLNERVEFVASYLSQHRVGAPLIRCDCAC